MLAAFPTSLLRRILFSAGSPSSAGLDMNNRRRTAAGLRRSFFVGRFRVRLGRRHPTPSLMWLPASGESMISAQHPGCSFASGFDTEVARPSGFWHLSIGPSASWAVMLTSVRWSSMGLSYVAVTFRTASRIPRELEIHFSRAFEPAVLALWPCDLVVYDHLCLVA